MSARAAGVAVRGATPADARHLHQLARLGGVLEVGSGYSYVLLCDHFRATTVVAEAGAAPIGFVTAYRPPTHPDTIFVWQVGVHPDWRGRGVARALLEGLLERPACADVRFLEATVAPSNEASRRLFASLARGRGAACAVTDGYPATLFAERGHEPEELFRIGPLKTPPTTDER